MEGAALSRQKTIRAALWAFLSTAGTRLITLGSLAVLARLLAPADFGLLAFALVYITYAETIGDLGTAVALIYWPDRREEAAQVTFLINLAMGAFWCILTLLLAPLVADFFDNPAAAPIIRVLAFAFLVKFLGNTHDALAQKDLRFRARAIPELGLALIKAAIAITLAAFGLGAWSLVWGHLGGLLIWTTLQWIIVPWRPSMRAPGELLVPMIRYGQGIVGVNMIAAVVHHADLLVVGRVLGSHALGLYQVAYKIPEATVTVVMWVVSKVLFPTFSKLQHSGDGLSRAYLQALKYVSFVTVPMAAGLFIVAEPLVLLFFGQRWAEAAPLLRWLAVYSGVRSLGTNAGDIMKATGHSGLLAGLGLVKAALIIPALILAGRYGVEAVAMTMAAVTALTVLINFTVVKQLLHLRTVDIGEALMTSAISGAALLLAGWLLEQMMSAAHPLAMFAAMIPACVIAYVATAVLIDRPFAVELARAAPFPGGGRKEAEGASP